MVGYTHASTGWQGNVQRGNQGVAMVSTAPATVEPMTRSLRIHIYLMDIPIRHAHDS